MIAMVALIFAVGAGVAGCGKDKSDEAGKGDKGSAKPAAALEKYPTAEEVAKFDCDKSCKTQLECYKKSGLKVDDAQTLKMCMDGCNTMKAPGVYKPEIHGKTAASFMPFSKGACK